MARISAVEYAVARSADQQAAPGPLQFFIDEMREGIREFKNQFMDKSLNFPIDDALTEVDPLSHTGLLAAAEA